MERPHNSQEISEKRPWTRRTHKPLELEPSDVFKPELVAQIRAKGTQKITTIEALKTLGIEVDETQVDTLNSALRQVNNNIFSHSDSETTFQGQDVDELVVSILNARFQIFEIAKLPLNIKDDILRQAPFIIHNLLEEKKLKQREEDWKK